MVSYPTTKSLLFIIWYGKDRLVLPESQKENNDLVDLLTTSFQKVILVENPEGRMEKQLELDTNRAWWQLHSVSSNTLGRFALELENFYRKAVQAKRHMSKERADDFAENIFGIVDSYRSSVDAKSSESISDKNNAIQTLIDKIKSNKIDRRYIMKDEVKKGIFSGIVGNQADRDQEGD